MQMVYSDTPIEQLMSLLAVGHDAAAAAEERSDGLAGALPLGGRSGKGGIWGG
jgi:hypothetical protein